MSDLTLFLSGELLEEKQFASRRHVGRAISEADTPLVNIADDRKLRLHRPLRAVAWCLLILPALIWVVGVAISSLARNLLGTQGD